MDPLLDDIDALTPEEAAHLKGVDVTTVRLAIRQGRLPGFKVHVPSCSRRRGPGRYYWRVWRRDALAWKAEVRQPRAGTVTVSPGPQRDGELSSVEAAALKGVSEAAMRQAIYTHRLAARWAPHATPAPMAVPTHGNTNQGNWYILRSDLEAWQPGGRNAGGAGARPEPVKAVDEMTVSEVAALKGVKPNTVRTAIVRGRLPAAWSPTGDSTDERIPRGRVPGRWLIKRSDAENYARG